jgi:hypothetical protein
MGMHERLLIQLKTCCVQGYWCPGGTPNRAFDPRSPDPDTLPPSGTAQTGTIYACPYGMLTVDLGATAAEQCCKLLLSCSATMSTHYICYSVSVAWGMSCKHLLYAYGRLSPGSSSAPMPAAVAPALRVSHI